MTPPRPQPVGPPLVTSGPDTRKVLREVRSGVKGTRELLGLQVGSGFRVQGLGAMGATGSTGGWRVCMCVGGEEPHGPCPQELLGACTLVGTITACHQLPPTATNHHQPPPAAANHLQLPPTATPTAMPCRSFWTRATGWAASDCIRSPLKALRELLLFSVPPP